MINVGEAGRCRPRSSAYRFGAGVLMVSTGGAGTAESGLDEGSGAISGAWLVLGFGVSIAASMSSNIPSARSSSKSSSNSSSIPSSPISGIKCLGGG